MHTIRVLLVNMPRLLREIVREVIATEPDLQVIDELTGGHLELAAVLDSVVADVVILGTESRESGELFLRLLWMRPTLRFVVIAKDGKAGFVCTPSGELSPHGLLEAVRGHA